MGDFTPIRVGRPSKGRTSLLKLEKFKEYTFPAVILSNLDHGKAGNQPKVANVESCDRVAEVQRRCADQQVFKCDAYAAGSLFALNLPGELSDFECYWMDEHVTANSSVNSRRRSRSASLLARWMP